MKILILAPFLLLDRQLYGLFNSEEGRRKDYLGKKNTFQSLLSISIFLSPLYSGQYIHTPVGIIIWVSHLINITKKQFKTKIKNYLMFMSLSPISWIMYHWTRTSSMSKLIWYMGKYDGNKFTLNPYTYACNDSW